MFLRVVMLYFMKSPFLFQEDKCVTEKVSERRTEDHLGSFWQDEYAAEASEDRASAGQSSISPGLVARGSDQVLRSMVHVVEDNREQSTAHTDSSRSNIGPAGIGLHDQGPSVEAALGRESVASDLGQTTIETNLGEEQSPQSSPLIPENNEHRR